MAAFTFKPAVRAKKRARIAILGPTGSGKTMTSLRLARGLAGPNGRIALIDAERGSATMYDQVTHFDHLDLPDHAPQTYVAAIHAADAAGYDVIVIDSLSHAWMGKGGALEQVDIAGKRNQGNSFVGWRDVTPIHNQMVDTILQSKAHVICTMRVKTEYVLEEGKNGKKIPRKVGIQPVQRDGMEYEFDLVCDLDLEHNLMPSKTRFIGLDLDGKVIPEPDEALGARIGAWLDGGYAPSPEELQAKAAAEAKAKAEADAADVRARLVKAKAGWQTLSGKRKPWAVYLWEQLERIADQHGSPQALQALRALYGGVASGAEPGVVLANADVRAVPAAAVRGRNYLACLLSAYEVCSFAEASAAVASCTDDQAEAFAGDLLSFQPADRAEFARGVYRSLTAPPDHGHGAAARDAAIATGTTEAADGQSNLNW